VFLTEFTSPYTASQSFHRRLHLRSFVP